jgi:hypothetical protein
LSGRNNRGRESAQLFNWLERLDQEAKALPRATDWLEPYGPFMLSRYAHLRPEPLPHDPRSKQECESSEASASQILEDLVPRIADHTETAVCLNGLNPEQQKQLSALLIETIEALEIDSIQRGKSQWARQVSKEARRRTRVLDRKLQKTRKAVEDLRSYAMDSDGGNSNDRPSHAARQTLGYPYRIAANHALRALVVPSGDEPPVVPDVKVYESLTSEYPTPSPPEVFGMVKLYWFFRHECSLSGDESEVRAALLRNAFWVEYGVRPVKYRPTYQAGESRGCDAVHVAVHRFRLS